MAGTIGYKLLLVARSQSKFYFQVRRLLPCDLSGSIRGKQLGSFPGGVVWVNSVSLDDRNPFSSISLDLKQSLSPGYINTYDRHMLLDIILVIGVQ